MGGPWGEIGRGRDFRPRQRFESVMLARSESIALAPPFLGSSCGRRQSYFFRLPGA